MAITMTLVHVGPNFMRYLLVDTVGGAAIPSITTTGAASPDLLTDSVQGPIRKAAKAFTQGYGALPAGALTQAQARAIYLGDDPTNVVGNSLINRLRVRASARTGVTADPVNCDANVDGGGHPVLSFTAQGSGAYSAYVDIECPGAIGD